MSAAEAAVGKRLKVWWDADGEWFVGAIVETRTFDDGFATEEVRIKYTDGQIMWHNLQRENFKWLAERRSESSVRGPTKVQRSPKRRHEEEEGEQQQACPASPLGLPPRLTGGGHDEAAAAAAAAQANGKPPPGWHKKSDFGKAKGWRGPNGQRAKNPIEAWRVHFEGADSEPGAKRQRPGDTGPRSDLGSDVWEIDRLVDDRGRGREFLVRWKGWSAEHDTWQAASDIMAAEAIEQYDARVSAAADAVRQAAAEGLTLERSDNASGFRGVQPSGDNRFKAYYGNAGRTCLGKFDTAEEAALAYALARAAAAMDQWAQCDACGKWRRLPAGVAAPDESTRWACAMVKGGSCEAPEEADEGDGNVDLKPAAELTLERSDLAATGYKGVTRAGASRFTATMSVRGKTKSLGTFDSVEEAALAFARARVAADKEKVKKKVSEGAETAAVAGEESLSGGEEEPASVLAAEALRQAAAEGLELERSGRNATGFTGVKDDQRSASSFRYSVTFDKAWLGAFLTAEEAALARARARAATPEDEDEEADVYERPDTRGGKQPSYKETLLVMPAEERGLSRPWTDGEDARLGALVAEHYE